ncbi:MAG: 3-hydroxybutyryl-CoA dehydrogenase [Myxococcota bacterium]
MGDRPEDDEMERIGVIGAGTMGHGIAQVCAMAGYAVTLTDAQPEATAAGAARIRANLDKGVARGKVTPEVRDRALAALSTGDLAAAADGADIVIEAAPERLELKQSLFTQVAAIAPDHCIFGTNTSSLSIDAIASAVPDPGRVIGTHFFNPVHIMALLEVVVGPATRPDVVERIQTLGARIGKEVIVVRDVPGFATSRLGVCLGMEAIRMVEQGVASAEDIDKAMVLGYRHPVGPLKLTDMVGLDVRLAIGEYLARELGNAAFEPPALMRQMVADGQLGTKTGRGFYDW